MNIQQAIQFLIQRLLKSLWIILPYKLGEKDEYRFNLLNPLGWCMLVCIAVYTGLASVVQVFVTVVRDALIAEAATRIPVKEKKPPK